MRPPPSGPAHQPPVEGSGRRPGARTTAIGIAVAALLLAGFFVVRSFGSDEGTPSTRAALDAGTALVTVQEPSSGQFRRLSTYDTSTGDLRPWAGKADQLEGGSTPDDVDRFAATPSPDRTRVAYLEGEQDGLPVPHVADADGSRDTLLMTSAESPCENTKRPAWSPDGRQMAVVCVVPGPDPDDRSQFRWSLWIVDATDGEGIREVVDPQPLILGAPTWDAETDTLYSWQANGPPPEDNLGTTGTPVQVSADRAHSQPRPVTDTDGQVYSDGDWAPPGLLAVRRPAGAPATTEGEIVIIDDDVVVVREDLFVNASWSPDHKTILATVNRDGGQKLVTLTDSGEVVSETEDLQSYGAPSWDTR